MPAAGFSGPLPTLAIYDTLASSIVPPSGYLARLSGIAEAGFKVVIPYSTLFNPIGNFLKYLDIAATLGLKVVIDWHGTPFYTGSSMVSTYFTWAPSVGAVDNTSFITNTTQIIRQHPAFWGHYVGDEPPPADHAQILTYSQLIQSLDPTHPRLIVAGGTSSTPVNNVTTQAAPYVDTCDYLGIDFYPFGSGSASGSGAGGGLVVYQAQCAAMQSLWTTNNLHGALVLQAFPYTNYAANYLPGTPCTPWPACGGFPTPQQQRGQVDLALLSCAPSLLIWYSYFDILTSGPASAANWLATVLAAQGGRA